MSERGTDDQILELTDEIARRWDPERLRNWVRQRGGTGDDLPPAVRRRLEEHLRVPLDIRVYTGEFAQEYVARRGADAVTVADTGMVLLGKAAAESLAQPAPDATVSGSVGFGERVLAHEAAHVAQATKGLMARGAPGLVDELEQAAMASEESYVAHVEGAPTPHQQQLLERVREKLEACFDRELDRQGEPW